MSTVTDHYEQHLGPVYTWMVGDIDAALTRSRAELDALGLHAGSTGLAVDLGAGFGLHALPLAERGFSVVAIDTCRPLLDELCARAGALPVRAVEASLLDFRAHLQAPAAVIVCMGDTLTHLPSHEAVEQLFASAAAALAGGGLFAATFRDYVSAPLQGDARFIPVRSEDDRILTCFLEYAETTVTVHDLLHERREGRWQLRASSYSKLRLDPRAVVASLSSLGFEARQEPGPSGMIRVVARLA